MSKSRLTAISPIDGRYRSKVLELGDYFSEFALFKYRLRIEIEYFIHLLELDLDPLRDFPAKQIPELRKLYKHFSVEDAENIKKIEKRTNHDIKAVEYFLRERFSGLGLDRYSEFIHFGLTSQDINNTALPLSCKEALEEVYFPVLRNLIDSIRDSSNAWMSFPMLARTHGQPASPTSLGKEIGVFHDRLERLLAQFSNCNFMAKFAGATGNFNAHFAAYPNLKWEEIADRFIESLGLKRLQWTTQIDPYDDLSELLQGLKRINNILLDFCRDIWSYISMEYFLQTPVKGEVGSSVMPHKVNPIDFENAEGNLGIANAIGTHLTDKLPISRLQRDLSDSTVLRNIGVPFSHGMIAIKSISAGLSKLQVNEQKLHDDLDANWQVVAEGYQTILRREGVKDSFEILKSFTRGKAHLTKDVLFQFIERLDIPDSVKTEMKAISPHNYTGNAQRRKARR